MQLEQSNTFIITLSSRRDRQDVVAQEFYKYGIKYTWWKAIKNENGRLGLIETMKELFAKALNSYYDHILVFEDDAKFIVNPHTYLHKCLEQLPSDFHLFYLGCNIAKEPVRVSTNILQTKDAYSSHAILYSREGIKLIMQQIEQATVYDMFLVKKIQSQGKCFCSYPLICSQQNSYSDIEKKVVDYTKFLEKRYFEKTRNV